MICKPENIDTIFRKERNNIKKIGVKLKKSQKNEFDNQIHKLHHDFFSSFNCLSCARCCKHLGPRITNKDIEKIAANLKIKQGDLVHKYFRIDEDGDYVFKSMPCPFLQDDNSCYIYSFKPKACSEYPHTNRKNFIEIIDISIKNCQICPIVLEIFIHVNKTI